MTNLEMLKLAAKAAGYSVSEDRPGKLFFPNPKGSCFLGKEFNPLEDDGDALRLAVKLGMQVTSEREVGCATAGIPDGWFKEERTTIDYDIFQATRCVIVKCAAEIGMMMP